MRATEFIIEAPIFADKEQVDEIVGNDVSKKDLKAYKTTKEDLEDLDYIGDLMGYHIYVDYLSDPSHVYVIKPTKKGYKVFGEIELESMDSNNSMYATEYTKLAPKAQGKGLGYNLYLFLMKTLKIILVSGETQSPGAMNLWKKLVANPDVLTWTQDPDEGKRYPVYINKQTGEIDGPQSPYNDPAFSLLGDYYDDVHDLEYELEEAIEELEAKLEAGKLNKQQFKMQKKQLIQTYERMIKDTSAEEETEEVATDMRLYALWNR